LEKKGKTSIYIQELSDLALLQIEIGEFEEAEKNLSICLTHFKKQKDRLGISASLGLLGTLLYKKGDNEKSIEACEEALKIYKELHQYQEMTTCLKMIGLNYFKLKKYDEATDVFIECSSICSDHEDIHGLLDCLANLITIHETQENWEVVEELYRKTLKAYQQLKDQKGIIVSLLNLGIINKKYKKHDSALTLFKKAIKKAEEANLAEYILKGLSLVGESLFYMGQIKAAKDEFIKALKLAKKINAKNAIIQLTILLQSLGLKEQDIQKELNEQ